MSPSDIEVLIHYHAVDRIHPRRHAPAVVEATTKFLNEGIIDPCDEHESGYELTERGRAWLEMILNTPYPEKVWVDPRRKSELPILAAL